MNSLTSTHEPSSLAEAASSIRVDSNIGKLLQDAGKLKPRLPVGWAAKPNSVPCQPTAVALGFVPQPNLHELVSNFATTHGNRRVRYAHQQNNGAHSAPYEYRAFAPHSA